MLALVSGASGSFGAHLAKLLLAQGHEVISIRHDDAPVDTAKLLGISDRITWAKGSILDERFCRRVVADYGIDTIFHLAALPLTQVATRTIAPIFQTNLMGTVHLLEAVKENAWAGKNIRFVYISTDKSYGSVGNKPYTEDMPLNGLAPYDCSKACADLATQTYAASGFAPSVVIVRPCNIIAPGDLNLGRILPRMIFPCLRGENPTLYKTEYLREFIAVEDAVKAIYLLDDALRRDHSSFHGQAFNIGSGNQRSLEQVVNVVLAHFPSLQTNWIEAPPVARVEIPFQLLSTKKIQYALGWRAEISFETAVENLIHWWKANWEKLPDGLKGRQIKTWHG